MKKFPTLREFLFKAGVNKETPPDRVQSLKKQYKQVYQKWYQLKRKQDTLRYTLRFTKAEFADLKRVAERYAPSNSHTVTKKAILAPFIKKAVLAYISKQYLPRDEKLIRELRKDIRAIGNNINQVVRSINQIRRANQFSGAFREDEFQSLNTSYLSLQSFITELESKLDGFMKQPTMTLKQTLQESLQDRPDKINQLIEYLLTIKNRTNASNKK